MTILPPPALNRLAYRIADAVERAWAPTHDDDPTVPISILAGLSLIQPGPDEHALAREGDRRADEVLLDMVRVQWHHAINHRPELAAPLSPLVLPWHGDHSVTGAALHGARDVATSATRAGLFTLTADADTRGHIDLLGMVLTVLRGGKAGALGGHYLPPGIADLMANATGAENARVVHEPNVGTGGLWRATSQAMRKAGRDPSEATWVGLDLDPLALACAATNAICWGLGHRVVLGVGDGLDPTAEVRAHIQRAHALRVAEEARADRRMRNALYTLTQKKEA